MKKIAFLIFSMDIGGTEKVTQELINEYSSRGFDVKLICLKKQGMLLSNLKIPSENIIQIGSCSKILDFILLVKRLQKLLRQLKPDYLISMGEWPNIISPFVKFSGKTVLVEHNTKTFFTEPNFYNLNKFYKLISIIAYKKAPVILCVSKDIKNKLDLKNKRFCKKTFVVYNPINFDKISIIANETINYSSDKIKIINVGRLTKQKNIPLLLKAFQIIKNEFNNVELWLVGDGPLREKLQEITKEYKISDSVVFWKYQENPYKYISKADFLVSSSDFEGFHLAIFESLYLKKRIVTTRSISDFDELITDDLGKIIPVNNLDELVDAIRNEIIYKKSINEIPKFLDSFKIKNVANKYLEYIDK